MGKILTRFGDGTPTEMSESELRADLEAGTEDAADRGKIPPLTEDELNHLFDIFSSPYKFISVEPVAPDFHVGAIICQDDFLPGLHTDKFIG